MKKQRNYKDFEKEYITLTLDHIESVKELLIKYYPEVFQLIDRGLINVQDFDIVVWDDITISHAHGTGLNCGANVYTLKRFIQELELVIKKNRLSVQG